MKIKTIILISFVSFLISACASIKTTEGNFIFDNKLASIKLGMNKEELRDLLGPPTALASLNENTWYYIYETHTKRLQFFSKSNVKSNVVIIKFNNDTISSIDIKNEKNRKKIPYLNINTKDTLKKTTYNNRKNNSDAFN